jgi:hypothetical protein
MKDLKKFDKDAVTKFYHSINKALALAKNEARSYIPDEPPLSGWSKTVSNKPRMSVRGGRGFPAWEPGRMRAGVVASRAQGKVRKKDYTTSAGALINKTPAGAIFELAGRKPGGGRTASGTAFKKILSDRNAPASRVVWRAVDRNRDKIEKDFARALLEAEKTLQIALESNK